MPKATKKRAPRARARGDSAPTEPPPPTGAVIDAVVAAHRPLPPYEPPAVVEPKPETRLVDLRSLRDAIARAATVEQAVGMLEDAKALATSSKLQEQFARMSGEEALVVRREAIEATLWAERRVGELLGEAQHGGDRKGPGSSSTLELDLPKATRSRFRSLAKVPPSLWATYLAGCRERGEEPTQRALLALAPAPEPRERARPVGGGRDNDPGDDADDAEDAEEERVLHQPPVEERVLETLRRAHGEVAPHVDPRLGARREEGLRMVLQLLDKAMAVTSQVLELDPRYRPLRCTSCDWSGGTHELRRGRGGAERGYEAMPAGGSGFPVCPECGGEELAAGGPS